MRHALAALVVAAGLVASAARADTGTYHRCLLDGGGTADVYTSGSGRDVTFDVQGARFEVHAQGGRFRLRAGQRTYAFDPRFLNPPGILTITTPTEHRIVQCPMP